MTANHGRESRLRKALEFVRFPRADDYMIRPHPWSEPGHPYHFGRPLDNADGHGGYTRKHAFDAAGIPFTPSQVGAVYHPLVVARYAMKMLEVAEATTDAEAGRRGRAILPILREAGRLDGVWGTGPAPERMSAPAPSCIVQGVVLSALIRLCDGRPDAELAALIDRAISRMLLPAERGGTRTSLQGGSFLEETPGTPVVHVLNGCHYGLLGLYDAADALDHPEAGRTAREIEITLSRVVDLFTAPLGWTWYALRAHGSRYLARGYYHSCHIVQARVVAARTGDPTIGRAEALWSKALNSPSTRLLMGAAKSAQVVWMRDIRRVPLRSAPW